MRFFAFGVLCVLVPVEALADPAPLKDRAAILAWIGQDA